MSGPGQQNPSPTGRSTSDTTSPNSDESLLELRLRGALSSVEHLYIKRSRLTFPRKDDEIGLGGFGSVYRAILDKKFLAATSSSLVVAVKRLRPAIERVDCLKVAIALLRELIVWADLDHPNIVPLLGFYLGPGYKEAWLVSAFASNGNVAQYLAAKKPDFDERLELVKDSARGLEYLHNRVPPVCHGDIKAANILVSDTGRAMLCDFGLARSTEGLQMTLATTGFNTGGTIRYQSPELFTQAFKRTAESDVWAFGCLCLEIISGLAPFYRTNFDGGVAHQVIKGNLPADLETLDCPEFVREVMWGCWQMKPYRRPKMSSILATLTVNERTLFRFSEDQGLARFWDSQSSLDALERDLARVLAPLEHLRLRRSLFTFAKSDEETRVGGFGSVHRAKMTKGLLVPSVVVAVKKLRAAGDKSKCIRIVIALVRELTVWSSFDHPNILPLLGFYLNDRYDEAWLVSNYMQHGNINEYIAREKPDAGQRLKLAIDTAEGLRYLHTLNPPVCHGDIKPLNVLVNDLRRAMICDFGLARSMESMPSGLTTSTFNQCGSIAYQSPELVTGASRRSLESDVWAWGCLLHEMFTGRGPYWGVSNLAVIVSHETPPADLDSSVQLPTQVRELLARCWQRDPRIRPTMQQCRRMLAESPLMLQMVNIPAARTPGCFAFSRDATLFAVGLAEVVRVCYTLSGDVIDELHTPGGSMAITFNHDASFVIIAGGVHLITWQRKNGRLRNITTGHTALIQCLDVSPDGAFIVSGAGDNSVRLCYPNDERKDRTLHVPGEVLSVAISADSRCVAASGEWNGIHIWDVSHKSPPARIRTTDWVRGLRFSGDGRYLVGGGEAKAITTWDVTQVFEEGIRVGFKEFEKLTTDPICSVVVSPNGSRIVSLSVDGEIRGAVGSYVDTFRIGTVVGDEGCWKVLSPVSDQGEGYVACCYQTRLIVVQYLLF